MIIFEADGATSKIVDGAPAVKSRLTEIEVGKRKSKSTEHWLVYQVSQLKERRKKLHARVLRNSIAVDVLLCSARDVEAVREQMLHIDGVFKMRCIENIFLYCS